MICQILLRILINSLLMFSGITVTIYSLHKINSYLKIEKEKAMAIAKKCDVCGKFYEPYNEKNDPKNVNGFMLINIDKERKYYVHNVTDCCPECMDSILNYINKLKVE